ncbi:cell division protein FtsQ/DivIB [Ornithinimicrobium cavernae]|uniref:cell division protein FtsQ/DivIB n=1 Tax=Ornithinimicrobium cavernae TaxID=2666047 RepID=UPI000D695A05|nr:FtsQ-type POTRA domain-containing protein [Ornithinimicrobium cavernae]
MRLGRKQNLNQTSRSANSWTSTQQQEESRSRRQSGTYRWGRRKGQPKPHPRLRQRAAEIRRRPWRVVGVLALVLALVAGVVYLFGFSSAFEVEKVTVAGAKGHIAEVAQETAEVNLGRPLARVNASTLEQRILEDLRVASVEIHRDWPSGLTLDLTLRKTALAVKQSGTSGVLLVDDQGVVFNNIAKAPKGAPTAQVMIRGDELDPADLVALQTLPDSLPKAVAKQAGDLTLTRQGDIKFTIGNIEVVWGDGSNAALKGRVLEALLAQEGLDPKADVPATGPMMIDVATPTTPVVTGLVTEEPTS